MRSKCNLRPRMSEMNEKKTRNVNFWHLNKYPSLAKRKTEIKMFLIIPSLDPHSIHFHPNPFIKMSNIFPIFQPPTPNFLNPLVPRSTSRITHIHSYVLASSDCINVRNKRKWSLWRGIFEHYLPESMLKNYSSTVIISSYFKHCVYIYYIIYNIIEYIPIVMAEKHISAQKSEF